MIINHHYDIEFVPQKEFIFNSYNKLIDVTSYKNIIADQIEDVAQIIRDHNATRQAVIMINQGIIKHNSCLLSLQFQIHNNELFMIANYRSQCEVNGRPNDTIMLRYIATKMISMLKLKELKVSIHVNVGNYHINKID